MAKRGVLAESIGTAALAGLLFGFDTAVVSGVTGDIRSVFHLTETELGPTVAAAVWGTLIGALTAGVPGDRYGGRQWLRVLALLYVVSGVGAAAAWNLGSFVAMRFLTGLAIGGSSVLAPVYIAEIAPAERRGRLVGLFQFNVVLGILVAYVSNAIVARLGLGDLTWRIKLAVPALPAVLFLLLLFRIPDSPRWLLSKGRVDEAETALARIGAADPQAEIAGMRGALAEDAASRGAQLSWSRHRKPILLAVLVAMFNQLTGINAILYYANDIFAAAGFHGLSADLPTIAVGAVNLLATMLGLALIDRIGRRALLLGGSVGMAACLALAAAVFAGLLPAATLLGVLIVYMLFFAPGQGAVIWVYISEVFPTAVRARGTAVGSSTHWGMNAVIVSLFPLLRAWSTPGAFGFFAICMAIQFVVVLLFFPETRGVTLEAMDARMKETG